MIKGEDDHLHEDDNEANGKRRRVQRACDVCRKKKIRCDGLQPEKGACSNCASYGLDCTFADAVKRRAPPRSYVIALEARMEKAEEVIAQLAPYLDVTKILGPMPLLPSDKKEGEEDGDSPPPFSAPSVGQQLQTAPLSSRTPAADAWDGPEDEEEDEDAAYLRTSLNNATINDEEGIGFTTVNSKGQTGTNNIFSLTSSRAQLFNSSTTDASSPGRRSNNSSTDAPMQFLGRASHFHILPLLERMSQNSNMQPLHIPECNDPDIPGPFEAPFQVEEPDYSQINFAWPAPDLQQKLIDAYFSRPNRDMPILNEVVTRRIFANSSWPSDGYESIVVALGMFCVASRYTDDPRLLSADEHPVSLHWFRELQLLLINQFASYGAGVPYLQATLLSTTYMSAIPKATIARAWVSLSLVVRMLEDSGAHRKFTAKRLGYSLLTEETYKRIWWVTYVMDRQLSSELGRPMSIQDEDFDLDEILLINDKYLVQASEAGTEPIQPLGELCVYDGFLQTARLSQVVGRTLRTIYAISKSKISRGFVGRKWDALVVADIDKSLNKWLESVPDHLRYNPNENNIDVLMQSSKVFVQYYHTQTLIHRPFIQSEKMESNELTFKSLAIVSNAARSAIHIIYNLQQRGLVVNSGSEALARTFAFGCMLLFISWSAHVKHLQVSKSIMSDVYKCLDIFQAMRTRWSKAVEMGKVMEIIIQRSQLPFNAPTGSRQQMTGKRGYEDESTSTSSAFTSIPSTSMIKSTSRDARKRPLASQLPLSTMELQSAFNGESSSPESQHHPTPSSIQSRRSQSQSSFNNPQLLAESASSFESLPQEGSVPTESSGSLFSNVSNTGAGANHWPSNNAPIGQPPSRLATDKTSIESTIFDPSNPTLDALLNGSNARPSTSSHFSFGTPSAGNQPFDTLGAFQGAEDLVPADADGFAIGSSTNLTDPLDALVNIQSLWSDVDWMRALEYQQ